jgi:hypothetical protein
MDFKANSNDITENNKIIELKKEEAKLKDQLKKIAEVKDHPNKKVFIPLLNNSKIAFFEAKIKGSSNIYTNLGEYVIQSTIDRKMNKINKSIALIQRETNQKIKRDLKEPFNINNKNDKTEKIIYNEKQEKIGQLKKLNDDLFEIIEDEYISENIELENETNKNDKDYKEKIIYREKDNTQDTLNKKLEEMKKTKNKYKDTNYINFADQEFL